MTKTVVLLNSAFITKRKDMVQNTEAHLRIGVANLSACLLLDNHHVIILDPQLEKLNFKQLVDRVVALKPDVLGLPAYTEEVHDTEHIARDVKKELPSVVTVLGGQQVTALPQESLEEFPSIDIGVVGEGETTFRRIINGEPLESIPGIVYREGSDHVRVNASRQDYESLDELPFPAWHLYDLKRYGHVMPIEPLRGCPFTCIFCFRALGTQVRYKSPSRVLDELEYNIREYGFRRYAFKCGTFPLSKSHAMQVFDGIKKRGLDIEWIASTRVDVLDEEIIQAMKDSGCIDVSLGIESGDAEVLKHCGKNTSPQQAENVLKLFKKVGIRSLEMNFILGLPGESKKSLQRTRDFVIRMRNYSSRVNFAILTAFPGTRIYEKALNGEAGYSLKSKDWRDYGKQAGRTLHFPAFRENELVRFQLKLYLAYYLLSPWKIVKLFTVDRFVALLKKMFVRVDKD